MNASIPTALALAGTALMAVAIFGPFHRSAPDDVEDAQAVAPAAGSAAWPALVEPSAASCDAAARIDLAEALGALRSEWAETILRQALETEAEPSVRSAISTALSSSQSLVT